MKGRKRKCSIVLKLKHWAWELGPGSKGWVFREGWSVLAVSIIYCSAISFLPAASRLHRTSAPTSSRHQDLSQATKLTLNLDYINSSTQLGNSWWHHNLGMLIWAAKRVCKHRSAPSHSDIKQPEWDSISCSSGEQQSKWKQQKQWCINSSRKISGLGENSCVLSCDNSLNNSKLCLSLAEERRKLPQYQPVQFWWQDQGLRHHKQFPFGIQILRYCRKIFVGKLHLAFPSGQHFRFCFFTKKLSKYFRFDIRSFLSCPPLIKIRTKLWF